MWQVSSITRRFLIVWPFFLPLSSSCWSSGSAGRWIGRSVPSCQQGETQGPPQSVWRRTSPLIRQRCELEVNPDGIMLDSTRDEGGESTYSHSIATSQRADLALLEEDAVSHPSE